MSRCGRRLRETSGRAQSAPAPSIDVALVVAGTIAIACLSSATLDPPQALAASGLGALMIAGAEMDARFLLLPDATTLGGVVVGLAAAALLAHEAPLPAVAEAGLRAICVAGIFELLRRIYERRRGAEGLGLGDVKLAAAIGAWLPLELVPVCVGLASSAALASAGVAHLRGAPIGRNAKLPFGAFLCPALWLTFFASALGL